MSKPRSLYVKLISEEGTEFILSRAAAYQSRILRGLFETMDSSNNMDNFETNLDESDFRVEMPVLPLEEIGAKVLDLVCQYLSERYVSSCHMSDFSQLKCLDPSNDEDRQLVLDLLLAADYLDSSLNVIIKCEDKPKLSTHKSMHFQAPGKSFIIPRMTNPKEHKVLSEENVELYAKLASIEGNPLKSPEELIHSTRLPRIVENNHRSWRRTLNNSNVSRSMNQSPVTSESSQSRAGRWTRAIPSQSRITNMSNKHQLSPTSVFPGNFAKKHLLSGRRNNSDYCELEECIDDVLTPVHELERAKSRSRIAFKRVTDKYKALLRQKQRQIDEMREISDGTAPGGSMYMDLQRAYEASQSDIRKLQLKVKSLVKMLDRAGATIRLSAEERREASSWVDTDKSNLGTVNEDAAEENVFSSRIDWSPVKEVMKDVIVYGRTDNQILNEIVLYIQKLNYQIADPEQYKSSTRLTTAKVDAEKETLFKTVEQQRKEIASLTEALAQAL